MLEASGPDYQYIRQSLERVVEPGERWERCFHYVQEFSEEVRKRGIVLDLLIGFDPEGTRPLKDGSLLTGGVIILFPVLPEVDPDLRAGEKVNSIDDAIGLQHGRSDVGKLLRLYADLHEEYRNVPIDPYFYVDRSMIPQADDQELFRSLKPETAVFVLKKSFS